MSIRERWTVYPLLFLTLGIAIKDKVERRINTDTVICRNLWVTDRDMKPQVLVASQPAGGLIDMPGNQRSIILGHTNRFDGLVIADKSGHTMSFALPPVAQQQGATATPPATTLPAEQSKDEPQKLPEATPVPQE